MNKYYPLEIVFVLIISFCQVISVHHSIGNRTLLEYDKKWKDLIKHYHENGCIVDDFEHFLSTHVQQQ